MDVIFTIVSRNYAAQAATLMQSLAAAEPAVRRVVVATDGPIPALGPLAEVIDARETGAPLAAMSVYYDALELNTAVKPYVFRHLLSQAGVGSAVYLDPDIFVFRPLDAVRHGLAEAQLVLTPHLTRPLLGEASPNDHNILRSGVYNLGFCAVRGEGKGLALVEWWADRCRFDCRVDLPNGLFTDQRWMDLSPGFVDSVAIHREPDLNLAYWNVEGRTLAKAADGWTVDGMPLVFFHFSGFDPTRPKVLSKHQNRIKVATGSPLAALLGEFAEAMLRNGHVATSAVPYAHDRFHSGRAVSRLMRRKALRAARAGEAFADGLGPATEAWFDAPDPETSEPGLPDITRLMEQVWFENPGADPFDRTTTEGRLAFSQWFVDNAAALGVDAPSVAAAERLAKKSGGSARSPDPEVWRDEPWTGAASDVFGWLREPGPDARPRACLALLAARGDLRQRIAGADADLLAWCLGPEAAAGRFAVDLLPQTWINALAGDPTLLYRAAQLAERNAAPSDLRRRLSAGFGAGERARWPAALTAPMRAPYLARPTGLPAPFIRLFADIWEQRPDLQRLYPLGGFVGRLRYLRWLLAGGLAEYGVELDALPAEVLGHPLMRVAAYSVRRHRPPAPILPASSAALLAVVEATDGLVIPPDVLVYEAATGRFQSAQGPAAAPGRVERVAFLTAPGTVAADAIALHAKGVIWSRAVGVWAPAEIRALSARHPALGFVDEIWTTASAKTPRLGRPVRRLEATSSVEAALAALIR